MNYTYTTSANLSSQQKIVKFSYKSDFDHIEKELTFKTNYIDGLSMEEMMNLFRQFLVMLGFFEDSVSRILLLDDEQVEILGLTKDDLSIVRED